MNFFKVNRFLGTPSMFHVKQTSSVASVDSTDLSEVGCLNDPVDH